MRRKHDELKAAIEKGIVDDTKAVGKAVALQCVPS